MKLIFEKSCDGHRLDLLPPCDVPVKSYPDELLRKKALLLPELSENGDQQALHAAGWQNLWRQRWLLSSGLLHDEIQPQGK